MTPLIMIGAILAMITLLPVVYGVGMENRRLRAQLEQARRPVKPPTLSDVRLACFPVRRSVNHRWRVVETERLEVEP